MAAAVVWKPGDDPPGSLRAAADAAGRADLAIVLPGVQPLGDWLALLVAAAHSDAAIATASAMLSDSPFAPFPLPADDLEDAAASVAEQARRLRPHLSAPLAGCVLVRRSALDAAGVGDEPGSPAAELADFAERCTALGLGHVLADDVLAAGAPAAPSPAETATLDARYPHRAAARAFDAEPESPDRARRPRRLARARQAVGDDRRTLAGPGARGHAGARDRARRRARADGPRARCAS